MADWGASYAFVSVPYEKDGQSRHVMVGWTYEVSGGLAFPLFGGRDRGN